MRRTFLLFPVLLISTLLAAQDSKQDFADAEFFLAEEEYEEYYNRIRHMSRGRV